MWKDLTIEQKAEIFRTAVSAGLTSLDEIKKLYNKQSKMNTPDIDDPYPEGMGENYYGDGGHTDIVEDYYYPITPVPSDYTTSVENTILYPINNFLTYNGNLFKKGGKANNRVPSWQTQKAQDLWWSKGQRIYNMMINEWGLTPAEAIGIIANMAIESGFDPNIKSPVDKHGVSYTGLVQNEPSIVNYIKKYYGDYSEASQLQFLRDGLEGKMRGADKNRQGKGLQKRLQEYKAYVSKLDPNDELIYRRAAGAFNAHYENPQIGASKGVYEVGEPRMYTGEQMGIRLGRTTQTTTPTVQPTIQPTVQQTPISDRKIVASPPTTTNKEEKKAYSPKYKAEREGEWEYSGPNIPYIDKRLPPDVALLLAGVPFKHTNEWGKIRSSNAGYGVAKSHHSRRFDSNTNISKAWDEYRTQLKTMVPEEDWPEVEKKLNELDEFVRTGTHPAAIDLNGWFGYNKDYNAYKDAFKGLANPALVRYSTEAGYGALREWTKEEQRAYRATGPNIHFGPSRSSKYLLATNPHVTPYNTYWEDRAALMSTSLPVQETPSIENVDYSDIYAENIDTPTVYENEVERKTGTQVKGGFDNEEGAYFNPVVLDEVVVTPPKISPSEEDDARMLLDNYYFGNNIEMPLRNGSIIPDLIMPNYVSHIPQTPMLEVNMSTPYTDLILGRGRNIAKNGGRINIFDDGGLTNLYTLGEDEYGIYPLSEVEATPNIGNLEARSKLREIFGGDMVAATKYMEGIPVDENSDNHEITHINNLYYLWKKAGSPKYTNSGSFASLGDPIGALMNWDKRYFYRPTYHPNTFLTDNVIYVPHESEKWKNESFYDEYLAELSHAIQFEGIGRGETFDKLDENNPLNKESAYSTPYTTEYNAHTIIEPKLRALLEFYNEDSDEARDLGWNIFKEKVLNAANPGREVQESLANEYINRIKAEFKTANEHIDPRSALPTIMYPNVNLNGTLNNEVYKYKNGGKLFPDGGFVPGQLYGGERKYQLVPATEASQDVFQGYTINPGDLVWADEQGNIIKGSDSQAIADLAAMRNKPLMAQEPLPTVTVTGQANPNKPIPLSELFTVPEKPTKLIADTNAFKEQWLQNDLELQRQEKEHADERARQLTPGVGTFVVTPAITTLAGIAAVEAAPLLPWLVTNPLGRKLTSGLIGGALLDEGVKLAGDITGYHNNGFGDFMTQATGVGNDFWWGFANPGYAINPTRAAAGTAEKVAEEALSKVHLPKNRVTYGVKSLFNHGFYPVAIKDGESTTIYAANPKTLFRDMRGTQDAPSITLDSFEKGAGHGLPVQYIESGYPGKGYGKGLYAAAINEAQNQGYAGIEVGNNLLSAPISDHTYNYFTKALIGNNGQWRNDNMVEHKLGYIPDAITANNYDEFYKLIKENPNLNVRLYNAPEYLLTGYNGPSIADKAASAVSDYSKGMFNIDLGQAYREAQMAKTLAGTYAKNARLKLDNSWNRFVQDGAGKNASPTLQMSESTPDYSSSSLGLSDDTIKKYLSIEALLGNEPMASKIGTVRTGFPENSTELLMRENIERNVAQRRAEGESEEDIQKYIDHAKKILQEAKIGYFSSNVFKGAGQEKAGGMYNPKNNFVSVNTDGPFPILKVEGHEGTHLFDNSYFPTSRKHSYLTPKQENILSEAYDDDFLGLENWKDLPEHLKETNWEAERVTTNRDARRNIVESYGRISVEEQNKIIDKITDDEIFTAVDAANGYGHHYIEYLRQNNKLTHAKAQQFREAMKKVGSLVLPITSISYGTSKK